MLLSAQNGPTASMNQVATLSSLTATRKVGQAPTLPGRCGTRPESSASSNCTRSVCRHSSAPEVVATQGCPRLTSTLPTRSSSSLTRCETAEGETFRSLAARSKDPCRITAASASSRA